MEHTHATDLTPRRRLWLLTVAGAALVCVALMVASILRTLPMGFIGPVWFSIGMLVMFFLMVGYAVAAARSPWRPSRRESILLGASALFSLIHLVATLKWQRFFTWDAMALFLPAMVGSALMAYVGIRFLQWRRP